MRLQNRHAFTHKFQLARAGFFYKPTAHSDDSVTCFLCHKTLDGWDADDKPALEHLAHVPDCGWAINICIEHRNQNMDPLEEDPLSDKMVEARRATFQDRWPHENKKGWKCKVQKVRLCVNISFRVDTDVRFVRWLTLDGRIIHCPRQMTT